MFGLLQLILQIIMKLLIPQQKKQTARTITGLKNPTKKQISDSYQKLISDLKKMQSIGLDVSKIAKALYINLNPKKFAKNGLNWYQESQIQLNRIVGNTVSPKEGKYREKTISIREQDEYIKLYLPFASNCFIKQVPYQELYIKYDSNYIYLMQREFVLDKVAFSNRNSSKYIELFLRFFCNLYGVVDYKANQTERYKQLTNKVLTEIVIDFSIAERYAIETSLICYENNRGDYIRYGKSSKEEMLGDTSEAGVHYSKQEFLESIENKYSQFRSGKYA